MRVLAVAAAALVLAATAAARNPHDPQEKLTPADNATARGIILKKADLVGTWKASGPDKGADPPCKTFDPDLSDLTLTGKAESPDFERADGVTVSSSAEVYATAADMRASFDRSIKPKLVPCVDAAFRSGAGKEVAIKMLMGRRAPVPRLGERTARYQFVWAITNQGRTIKGYADAYFVGKGRNGVSIFFFSTPAQVTAKAQLDLVRQIARRL